MEQEDAEESYCLCTIESLLQIQHTSKAHQSRDETFYYSLDTGFSISIQMIKKDATEVPTHLPSTLAAAHDVESSNNLENLKN